MNSTINKISEKKSRLRKRRGVADVISTMMLMAVTITGASTLTYFMNDAFVSGNLGTISTLDSSSLNLFLLAYDTRDSITLLSLPNIDNQFNSLLCGSSCSGTPNNIPLNGGTEFIVFQVQNNSLDSIFLDDVSLNGVVYTWDSSTSGVQLDATAPLVNGKYPSDGKFSILPVGKTPIIQNESIEIQNGQIVNILVKLSALESDIPLNKGIRLLLDAGNVQPIEYLIESGDAR
ncbi:MAG: hypothetical protein K5790_03530 [Nitrosopumilus sp.]|uniref:hypothetical protein n=1 Tax=Nitrosopumilus sp. TaxID=2024843 RepID=UPI00247C5340|nr:hypothetical protein [Nitrosopumilus sp.]MCV0392350.1 hypothetical protein [Nitrosopumilus sp.]